MKTSKYILAAALLLTIVSSCGKDYEAEFAAIEERIEKLKAADKRTRELILGEMEKLSVEITKRIKQMEDNVHKYLDESMSKVKGAIDSESDKISQKIAKASLDLGTSITEYASQLDNLIDSKKADFEASRAKMEKELTKAINNGDAALSRRIKNGIASLDKIQKDLPALVEKTQKRMDELDGLDKKYAQVSGKIKDLDQRRLVMKQMASDYQDELIDLVSSNLEEYASEDLEEYYVSICDSYNMMDDLNSELESLNSEMESLYSNMPDLESALSEAESLFADLEYLESYVSDFSPADDVNGILETLQSAIDLAGEVDIDISGGQDAVDACRIEMTRYEGAIDQVIMFVVDMEEHLEEYIDTVMDKK